MEEILFRGKRVNNGEWIYSGALSHGSIKRKSRKLYMLEDNYSDIWHEVIPETVGQCSYRECKDGVVYDGDILYDTDGSYYLVRLLGDPDWLWMLDNIHDEYSGYTFQDINQADFEKMRRVGNMTDNPELLEN